MKIRVYDANPGEAVTAFITVPMRTWMQDPSYRRIDEHFHLFWKIMKP